MTLGSLPLKGSVISLSPYIQSTYSVNDHNALHDDRISPIPGLYNIQEVSGMLPLKRVGFTVIVKQLFVILFESSFPQDEVFCHLPISGVPGTSSSWRSHPHVTSTIFCPQFHHVPPPTILNPPVTPSSPTIWVFSPSPVSYLFLTHRDTPGFLTTVTLQPLTPSFVPDPVITETSSTFPQT